MILLLILESGWGVRLGRWAKFQHRARANTYFILLALLIGFKLVLLKFILVGVVTFEVHFIEWERLNLVVYIIINITGQIRSAKTTTSIVDIAIIGDILVASPWISITASI